MIYIGNDKFYCWYRNVCPPLPRSMLTSYVHKFEFGALRRSTDASLFIYFLIGCVWFQLKNLMVEALLHNLSS